MIASRVMGMAAAAFVLVCRVGLAKGDALPAPSPAPSATPAPHGIELHGGLNVLFLTQGAAGPGLQPVEGPGFAQGAPAAPVSPYDVFSGAPMVPGNVQQNQFTLDALWHGPGASIGATIGLESLLGDRTNQAYWAEPLQPQDNPHLGSTATGFSIVFPTHPGLDDFNGARFGVLRARASLFRDALQIRGGWFDLAQTLGSVFTPAPNTNVVPSLSLKPPESLNPNWPALDAWNPPPAALPLRGFDAVYNAGAIAIEASDAQLPSLPGTPARLVSISAGHFNDDGHGAIVQWVHAHTGGDPISTTTGFGTSPQIIPTDQGAFLISTLAGQHQTIAGAKIVTPVGAGFTATAEYSHSSYRADGIGKPGVVGGSFEHAAFTHAAGSVMLGAHYYRFEPTFATMILPYGVPENIWSVAYSWPGPWLKSDFQLVDSTTLGINRQGPLLSLSFKTKSIEAYATSSHFSQIEPLTTANAGNLGFVEGFFLVQNPAAATLGSFNRTSVFIEKHAQFADLGLDFVDDGLHRAAAATAPFDAVSFDTPQYVASLSRHVSQRVVASAGFGYFGTRGSWADGPATNVDFGMHAAYAGAQFAQRGQGALMVTVRRSALRGKPYFGALGAVKYGSPDLSATTVLVEQRFRF